MGIKVEPVRSASAVGPDGPQPSEEIRPIDAGLDEPCLAKLQVGDLFFSIVCWDKCAPGTIRYWAMLAREAGAPEAKWRLAMARASEIEVWQKAHPERVKVPD